MKKIFLNDNFFFAVSIIGCIGTFIGATVWLINWRGAFQFCISLLTSSICTLILYFSYSKHSKNVMKGIMGALLMSRLVSAILSLDNVYMPLDKICGVIDLILISLIFINHFAINAEHHSKPANIKINQMLIIIYALNLVIWCLSWSKYLSDSFEKFAQFTAAIGYPSMCAAIVCVESRLDAYRIKREVSGWSEEKGYPEGYVHEYEKSN